MGPTLKAGLDHRTELQLVSHVVANSDFAASSSTEDMKSAALAVGAADDTKSPLEAAPKKAAFAFMGSSITTGRRS